MGGGRGEELTPNICFMFVTRDVSKLSGWLNAFASCRGSQAGRPVRGELRAGRREAAGDCAVHAAQECGRDRRLGGRAWGGAHVDHAFHVRDAGRVEAERLVERVRLLPRVAASTVRGELRAGWREAAADRGVHAACSGEGATAN